MIQYPISLGELARIVNKLLPTSRNKDGKPRKNGRVAWLRRAHEQTRQLRAEGKYAVDAKNEIWRELKIIFARIQGGGKCAFCEKLLDMHKSGRTAGDMEHYRPKSGVEVWLTKYPIPVGGEDRLSYYLLAFHLRNYLLVCGICNQDFKGNYFPIAGPRCPTNSNRARDLKAERPYLLHPLDPDDDDPEQLIEFIGITPVPRAPKGTHEYWRAMVTIEVLGLARGNRFDLDFHRAEAISAVYQALTSDQTDPRVARVLNRLQDNTWPHLNCARSFKRLYDQDPAKAKLIVEQTDKYVDGVLSRRKQPS